MDKESYLGRAVEAISKVFSELGRSQEKIAPNPTDFTPDEMKSLDRASRRGIIYGDYKGEGDLVKAVFRARAARIQGLKTSGITNDKETT